MLFGFVLALIAGYTLGQQPRQRLIMLWSVWLLARLLWLALPFSVWVYALNSVFFIGLSILAVPRFRAAKQWRNQMLVPLLLILCLILPLLFTAHLLGIFPVADRRQLQLGHPDRFVITDGVYRWPDYFSPPYQPRCNARKSVWLAAYNRALKAH